MKGIFLACLSVCVLDMVLADPVDTVSCVFGSETYADGETFTDGCRSRCTCSVVSGEAAISCVPFCALSLPSPGCRLVDNPDKDEEHSLNCCQIEDCEPVMCENGGKKYADGESWSEGCSARCTCSITNGEVGYWCVPMCAAMAVAPPCTIEENSAKDPATSTNCCPVVVCP